MTTLFESIQLLKWRFWNFIPESIANLTKKVCGCVSFSMSNMYFCIYFVIQISPIKVIFAVFLCKTGDANTKTCGGKIIDCYEKNVEI